MITTHLQAALQIALIGSSRLLREVLSKRLASEANCQVGVSVASVDQLLDSLDLGTVDVLLVLDADLAVDDLERLGQALAPQQRIVCQRTLPPLAEVAVDLAITGRLSWLAAGASYEVLLSVLRGETACSLQVLAFVAGQIQHRNRAKPSDNECQPSVTGREREIARLVGEGLINKLIAKRLGIRVTTVKSHVYRLMHKLQVMRRGDIARRLAGSQAA